MVRVRVRIEVEVGGTHGPGKGCGALGGQMGVRCKQGYRVRMEIFSQEDTGTSSQMAHRVGTQIYTVLLIHSEPHT